MQKQYSQQEANLAFGFIRFAQNKPELVAISGLEGSISYRQLMGNVLVSANRLVSHGVTRSSCIAINPALGVFGVVLTLATSLIGCRWVSATPAARDNYALLGITHTLNINLNRPMDKQLSEFAAAHNKLIEADPSWFKPNFTVNATELEKFEGYKTPEDIWMIAQTSGTTGVIKFVPYSFQLCYDRDANNDSLETVGGKRYLYLFPFFSAFLPFMLSKLMYGGTLVLRENEMTPELNVITGSPAHILQFIKRREAKKQFSIIDQVAFGGGKVSPNTHKIIRKYFKNLWIGYGSTEAGRTCGWDVSTKVAHQESVGKPLTGCIVEIVKEDRILAAGETGEVRVKTPYQAKTYIGGGTNTGLKNGWFYPGDLGHIDETGNLVIDGRKDEIVNFEGTKINIVSVDETIQDIEGVREGISFQYVDDEGRQTLGILLSLFDTSSAKDIAGNTLKILRAAKKKAPMTAIFETSRIPRNENGKPMRSDAFKIASKLQPILKR